MNGGKNPDLATQWRSLAQLPEGTLGAAVWAHYQNHGFQTPGELGGANAALAPSRLAPRAG